MSESEDEFALTGAARASTEVVERFVRGDRDTKHLYALPVSLQNETLVQIGYRVVDLNDPHLAREWWNWMDRRSVSQAARGPPVDADVLSAMQLDVIALYAVVHRKLAVVSQFISGSHYNMPLFVNEMTQLSDTEMETVANGIPPSSLRFLIPTDTRMFLADGRFKALEMLARTREYGILTYITDRVFGDAIQYYDLSHKDSVPFLTWLQSHIDAETPKPRLRLYYHCSTFLGRFTMRALRYITTHMNLHVIFDADEFMYVVLQHATEDDFEIFADLVCGKRMFVGCKLTWVLADLLRQRPPSRALMLLASFWNISLSADKMITVFKSETAMRAQLSKHLGADVSDLALSYLRSP